MTISSALVPVRGEASDDEAVRLACELINSSKGRLYILYVIEVERGFPLDAEIAPSTAKGEQILNHMEDVARKFKCHTEAELVQARQAGAAVVQEAVDKNVDAVVLGMPYKERLGSYSLGNTVPYILKNAPCRVILWRDSMPNSTAIGHN